MLDGAMRPSNLDDNEAIQGVTKRSPMQDGAMRPSIYNYNEY